MARGRDGLNLHEACYPGRLDVVAELLAAGADPNAPAEPSGRVWISAAGSCPRPLNCVAVAWTMTEDHVKIASLLIEHGAVVDDTVFNDFLIERASLDDPPDLAFQRILDSARSKRTG